MREMPGIVFNSWLVLLKYFILSPLLFPFVALPGLMNITDDHLNPIPPANHPEPPHHCLTATKLFLADGPTWWSSGELSGPVRSPTTSFLPALVSLPSLCCSHTLVNSSYCSSPTSRSKRIFLMPLPP